jgi:hypothetical protein
MAATMPYMAKPATRPVKLAPDIAEKVRLIAEWMTDTSLKGDGVEVSMGDLLSEWSRPHIAKYLEDAVKHDMKKKKAMLD